MNAVCGDQPVPRLVGRCSRAFSGGESGGWYRSCSVRFTKRQVPPSRGNDDRCKRRDNIFYYFDRTDRKRAVYLCGGHVSIIPIRTYIVRRVIILLCCIQWIIHDNRRQRVTTIMCRINILLIMTVLPPCVARPTVGLRCVFSVLTFHALIVLLLVPIPAIPTA